jgi:hypothetical protein
MPRGPKGEKRPADVVGNAVHVMRIQTETLPAPELTSYRDPKGAQSNHRRRFLGSYR